MGHQQPKTFERNYIAYTSFSDIQALSQDQPERLDLLRSLARSSSRRDVNAPNELPAEEAAEVYQSEELKEFDEDLRAALEAQDHAATVQVKNARRYKLRKLLPDRLKLYRKGWFEKRDGKNGRMNDASYVLEIPPHNLEMERRCTAAALFGGIQAENQVALVEDLATICRGKSAAKIGKSAAIIGKSTANTRIPAKYTETRFFRGADPSNGHCRFCNSDLSSMDQLHQVTHANQCFSRHHQINRALLSRFRNCEWAECTAYFPPFFDGSSQQSEIAQHIRGHIKNDAFVCLWSKGQCALLFDSRWKLRYPDDYDLS